MISNKKINVDLSNKNTIMNSLVLTQYDKGFYVEISLFDNGQPYTIEKNESIKLEFKLGNIAVIESNVTIIDTNRCKFKVRREMTLNSCKGTFTIAVVDKETGINIRKGSSKLAIEIMSSSVSENTVEPALITTAKEELDTSITEAENIKTSLDASIEAGDLSNYTLKEDFDNLEVGGRNLIPNSATLQNEFTFNAGYNGTIKYVDDEEALSKKRIEVTCTKDGTGFYSNAFNKTDDKIGKTYTWSFYAKCSTTKTASIGHECGGKKTITITPEWQKFSHTWEYTDYQYSAFNFYFYWKAGEVFYIRDFKIEEGTFATTWTPAPEDIENEISTLEQLISDTALATKKALYPVGSLYFNISSNTNPATLLGFGTWEQIAQGKTLVGVDTTDTDFNTPGKTGGSKTHRLSINEMPAHSHAQKISANFDDGEFSGRCDYDLDSGHMKEFGQGITTETAGGGQAFNIMPPYVTVYIWERTA